MSFGLVPADSGVTNGRVSETLVAAVGRFGQLVTQSHVTESATFNQLDATTGTFDALTASSAVVGTLDVAEVTTDALVASTGTVATLNSTNGTIATLGSTTGTIATLNSTTGTVTTLNSTNGTITTLGSTTGTITTLNSTTGNITTLNSTTVNATTFPRTLAGSVFNTLVAETALDVNVNPNSNEDVVGPTQAATTAAAVWFTPVSITVTEFSAANAGVPIANAIEVALQYSASFGGPTADIFLPEQLTNASVTRTGSVVVPAGSYISVHLGILGVQPAITATFRTSWLVTFH